uniref:SPATA31-like domain-containing protein n=1 Tax=Loxodonta africana TaxID=9785 RepID=G5E7F6_LOXAF
MLCPTFVWWHAGYPVYKYASIICLIVNIWRKKKKYHGFKLESNRSACEQCQRVSQRARDAPPRARRPSEEEAEKLQERLTVTKRQGWLPQEGRVLQLLYTNLYYHISDDTALDIEQLVTGKNTLITPTSAGTSPHSSCLESLSISGVSKQSLRLRSKNSREVLLASVTSTLLKLADQKSLTQMAGPSTGVVSIQDHWDEHLQLGKGFQLPDVPRDPGTTTSSRLEESGVPVNQQQ